MKAKLTVTALTCPTCGSALDGLRRDKLFACMACRVGVFIENGTKSTFAITFAPVGDDTTLPILYLPFWRLEVEIALSNATARQSIGASSLADLDFVWVAGFYLKKPSHFGDPGLELTTGRVATLGLDEPPDQARMVGITRSPEEATEYATLFITEMLDRRADVTGLAICVTPRTYELWAMPFADDREAHKLICLTTGKAYGSFMVEDLVEIRGG